MNVRKSFGLRSVSVTKLEKYDEKQSDILINKCCLNFGSYMRDMTVFSPIHCNIHDICSFLSIKHSDSGISNFLLLAHNSTCNYYVVQTYLALTLGTIFDNSSLILFAVYESIRQTQ